MRTRDSIEAELRLLVALRYSIRERSGQPSGCLIDEMLDERAAALHVR